MEEEVTGSDSYRARRLRHAFAKEGGDTSHTRLWENFDSDMRSLLTAQIGLQSEEIPIFAHYKDEHTWLVATTRRIIWPNESLIKQLSYAEIKAMGWSAGPSAASKRERSDKIDSWIETVDGRKLTKHASPWFFVLDVHEHRHEILLEPGPPVTLVWNSISLITRLEGIHPRNLSSN